MTWSGRTSWDWSGTWIERGTKSSEHPLPSTGGPQYGTPRPGRGRTSGSARCSGPASSAPSIQSERERPAPLAESVAPGDQRKGRNLPATRSQGRSSRSLGPSRLFTSAGSSMAPKVPCPWRRGGMVRSETRARDGRQAGRGVGMDGDRRLDIPPRFGRRKLTTLGIGPVTGWIPWQKGAAPRPTTSPMALESVGGRVGSTDGGAREEEPGFDTDSSSSRPAVGLAAERLTPAAGCRTSS